ncbi:MAG TPA: glucose-6-phosphate dehydrogenase, partial [Actinoplanes sp.]|nr:glucose-6-phosphate dehydrogenase [Actinoplanes sp.]
MIALWDTTGTEVVRALSAERRTAGGVASGLALTLVAVVDEDRVREAEEAAATAAAAHPCRLLIVVPKSEPPADSKNAESRLDAEIVVGGRLGPAEAVV